MPASENLLWQVAQGLNLALVPAIFAYLLWKREWTWTGLYIALCCAGAGWAQLNTLATVLGSADTAQRALATGAAMRAALFLGAAIGALRKPATASTFMVLGACLFLGYTGANALYRDLFSLDSAGSYAIGGKMVPDWAGLPTMVLFALGPCLIGLPWTLARQSNLQESLVSAAHERYAIVFGLGIAAFVIVSCGMLAWAYIGHGPFSGERLQPALALETNGLGAANLAVWVIMGAGMFVFWAFPRHFIEQAAKLIEASERPDVDKLADIAPPMWRSLAESLDQRREEARRSSLAAEEARAQLSAFFENVPVNMSLHDINGRYIIGSGQVAKSYGISEEELRTRDMQSLAGHWPQFGELATATIKAVTTGETQRIVTPFKSGEDAENQTFDVVIFPIRSADGAITQIGSLGIDITTQHKLLAELETKNSSMQAFFDNAPMLMFASDLDDRVTSISNWAQEKTGPDESNPQIAIGMKVSESRWPAWTEFAESSYQAAIERGVSSTANIQLDYAGIPRETLSVRFPIRDQTGQIVQIGGYILDITDQKKAETALAEREAMLAGIFDHAPVAITVFSRERKMVAANRAATGAYGMTRVGKRSLPVERFRPFWPEFDRFVELGLKVFETGERQQFNIAFNPPRGAPQEIKEAVYFPIFSSTGEVAQVGLFMIDVTEQARAQEELNRSSATLQAFFDNLPGMAFIASKDDRYLAANSFLADALGLEQLRAENLLGKPTTDFVPPHWVEIIAEANRAALDEGRLFAAETTIELADGEHHIWASRFPIRDAAGEATQIGGLLFDRTAEKRAEAELNASRESLHQSEKLAALGQLLAGVAHELNNPLTVVVGRSAILEEKLKETPHGKAIADLREAADRCNRIVRTFLAMARQSAPRRAAVQVNDAIEAALDMTAYGLRSSGIELVRRLDPALPEVEADEDQLVQVFTNLLINARHALEEHRPEGGKVTIATRVKADKLLVEIADNGAGVPAEIVSRIFEPFFTTKAVGDGTGMGLAMSKGMIEEHGGKLLYANAKGGGAVFTVELPLAAAAPGAAPQEDLEQPKGKGRGRVLVVDDEPSIRGLLVEILQDIELECSECGDGAAALELLGQEQFDMVFCDVRMPVMDGVRFRQHLAETAPAMLDRLVFISGDVLKRGNARRAEIADHPFVEKPFNPAEVRRLALSLLGGEGDKS